MIAVIADDFTGAAELAGISLRYGLKVSVCLSNEIDTDVDVLMVNTDSRSLKKNEAINATARAVKTILALKPELVYKKIDSVLRGYVIDELVVQLQESGFDKVFIMPANPSLGRTISNGQYFIDGKPIHESAFSADPEFPVKSSLIKNMLNNDTVEIIKHSDALPGSGIVVGECARENDARQWADKIDKRWMLAGAADFYAALLAKNIHNKHRQNSNWNCHTCMLVAHLTGNEKEFIKGLSKKLDCVSYLPQIIDESWINETVDILKAKKKLIIAIDDTDEPAVMLRGRMAKAVREILDREQVREIFIEGGSTAAAILDELKIEKLSPTNELESGVVRMKANDLFITVKPGSYELPDEIERLYNP